MPRAPEFGKWLKMKREEKGWTLEMAGKYLGWGTKQHLSQYEGGLATGPSLPRLIDIADTYSVPLSQVLDKLKAEEPKKVEAMNKLWRYFRHTDDSPAGSASGG